VYEKTTNLTCTFLKQIDAGKDWKLNVLFTGIDPFKAPIHTGKKTDVNNG
jgi:hypothetical protein